MPVDEKLKSLFICPDCRGKLNEKFDYFECEKCQKKIKKNNYIDFVGKVKIKLENKKNLEGFLTMSESAKKKYEGARELVANFGDNYIKDAYLILIKKSKLDFNNKVILEIGGGLGELAKQIKDIFPDSKYIFSDYIKNNIVSAINSKKLEKINIVITADIYNLPLKDKSVDVVILSEILEHLDKLSLAMKEIKRVLKKDGLVLASVPNSVMYFYPFPFLQQILNPKKLLKRLEREKNDNDGGFYHRPFLPGQFRNLFKKEGYNVLKHNSMGLFFFHFPFNRVVKKYPNNFLIKSSVKFLIRISDLIPAINFPGLKFIGMRQIIIVKNKIDMNKKLRILNFATASLSALKKKGNLGYANQVYNPNNFFERVYHISFKPEDRNIRLSNPTIEVFVLKWFFKNKYLNFPFFLWQIYKLAKEEKVELIRGRNVFFPTLLGLICAKLCKIPFVVSIGGDNRLAQRLEGGKFYFLNNKFLTHKLEETVLRGADKVIAPNEFSKNYLMSLGVKSDRIRMIPLCLKKEIFEANPHDIKNEHLRVIKQIITDFKIDLNLPIILFAGRLAGDKQPDVLIEAIPAILKNKPSIQFLFIGDGPLRSNLENRVAGLKIIDKTSFLGFQSLEVIKFFLDKSYLVWIPMAGFFLYEAAAMGKPIIAFDVEWHSELINNYKEGILVENRNIKKLAEAVLFLLNNPQQAKEMGKKMRGKIKKLYNPIDIMEKEINLYKDLLKNEKNN